MKVPGSKMLIRYQFKSDQYKERGIKKIELKAFSKRSYNEYLGKNEEHSIDNDN